MSISEFKSFANEKGYQESNSWGPTLAEFVNYRVLEIETKIYLCEVIVNKHFSSVVNISLPADVDWFITEFLHEYEGDLIRPWLSEAIRLTAKMMLSDEVFTKGIVGTTFMFGIVEFYAKHNLGWRPDEHDHFDNDYHKNFRKMYINQAISGLKKLDTRLGRSLSKIDNTSKKKIKNRGAQQGRWVQSTIADRLWLSRNTIVHGEQYNFYYEGKYLLMLYSLLHFHKKLELNSQ